MIQWFITDKLKQSRDLYISTKLILTINFFILPTAILLIPLFYYLGFQEGAIIAISAAVASAFFPFLVKFCPKPVVISNFFAACSYLVFASLMIFSGGASSPFLFWFCSIPPIGFLYLKKNHALTWLILVMATVLFIFGAGWVGVLPETAIPPKANSIIILFSFMLLTTLFTIVVYNFRLAFSKMNKRLRKTNEQLQTSNLDLERFAAVASHDLKGPVRNITSFVELLKKMHKDTLPPQGLEFIDIIDRNAKQAWQLIEDILEYSKATAKTDRREMVDMNVMVSHIERQLLENPTYAHAAIKVDRLPVIMGDETRLSQVFTNLIENGIKYNRSEQPQIGIRYHKRNNSHNFEIIDNGIGIDAKHVSRVFEMFKRLHNQAEFKGTGVGLAICQKVIDQMGGAIKLISIVGRGSTFRIDLPIHKEDHMNQLPAEKELVALAEIAN